MSNNSLSIVILFHLALVLSNVVTDEHIMRNTESG